MQLECDYIDILQKEIEPLVKVKLKFLFEEASLYDNVKIDINYLYSSLVSKLIENNKSVYVIGSVDSIPNEAIPIPVENSVKHGILEFIKTTPFNVVFNDQLDNNGIEFTVKSIRTYCNSDECGDISSHEIYQKPIIIASYGGQDGGIQQLLSFTYYCKVCKKELVSYLVKRDGDKLILSGRTPME